MTILFAYGTRPEYLKLQPIFPHLTVPYETLCTYQHSTLLSDLPKATRSGLEIKHRTNRLNAIVAAIMKTEYHPQLEDLFNDVGLVVVQGDTTSALAIALSAFHHQVPVAHVEAGLRTYQDHPFPEEMNRRLISQIACIHYCPTSTELGNLLIENVDCTYAAVTGNTIIDHLRANLSNNAYLKEDLVVVTMHRRENHKDMKLWLRQIDLLAAKRPEEFVFIEHPNPNVQSALSELVVTKVIKPLPYKNMVDLMCRAKAIITDSGGLQEEAAYLKVPCLVARQATERIEGIGHFACLVSNPENLEQQFDKALSLGMKGDCPYGDGTAGKRIAGHLNTYYETHYKSHQSCEA